MAGTQLYIGAPNGIVVCIDRTDPGGFHGRLFHKYSREGAAFDSTERMIYLMEHLFDELEFPRAGTNIRSFSETEQGSRGMHRIKEGMEKIMADEELLNQHGYQGTFIVRVQHRQNSTWQGRITWADQDRTLSFRSIWEMIHLMESAMATEDGAGTFADPAPWDKD